MKVGDYVRTKYGEICKLKKSKYKYLLYETDIEIDRHNDRDCNDYGFDEDTIKDIIKSSPNIIDLIEVGDYVNGFYVINKPFNQRIHTEFDDFTEEDIETIVTKEQFESMKYEVK